MRFKLKSGQLKTEKQKLETEKSIETKKIVSTMVAEHNAVVEWRQALDKEGGLWLDSTYTIEAEEALIRTDSRPILFFGGINDIVKKGDKYMVYFGDKKWFNFLSSADIQFVLECTAQQVDKIMSESKKSFVDRFAVVAKISEVGKVRFQLTASSSGYEEIDVELEPSNVFIATGHCLDLVFVGDYELVDFLGVYSDGEVNKEKSKKSTFYGVKRVLKRMLESF